MNQIKDLAFKGKNIALEWFTSPEALAQFGLLFAAFVLAWLVTKWISPRLLKLLSPGEEDMSIRAKVSRFCLLFLPLLLPLLAIGFTAAGEQVTRSIFDSGNVIAFGNRVFVFIAARILVKKIIFSPYLKMIGKYFLLPVAALYALGLLPSILGFLSSKVIGVGAIKFTADKIITAIVAASFLFWLGRWSNNQGTQYIRASEQMRPSVRELAAKSFELAVYGAVILLLVSILELPLTSLAVFGGAIGIGLGFGLQKIASNFVSGVILLLEGQATVGDFVELDGGEAGTIIKMMSRATILESFDGRWIVVPNEDFITTRVTNFSDSGSANRYSVDFRVSYDTDINKIPEIVGKAVAKHPDVLSEPEEPDVELSGFGESGIDFCVEFWVNGLDDGVNKYSSDVLFLIWNALKDNNIEIPYPRREVSIVGPQGLPQV